MIYTTPGLIDQATIDKRTVYTNLPALVDTPSAFAFTTGDRVIRTYPLSLLVRIGQPLQKIGTVTHTANGWVSVSWDEGQRSLVNPAYLMKAGNPK